MSDFNPAFDLDSEPPDFPETDYESLIPPPDDDFGPYDALGDEPPDDFDPTAWEMQQAAFDLAFDDDDSEPDLADAVAESLPTDLEKVDGLALHPSDPVYHDRGYLIDQAVDPEESWQAYLAAQRGPSAPTQLPLANPELVRFFGETRQEAGQLIHTINALAYSEEDAMVLGVAAFTERGLAEEYFSRLEGYAGELTPVERPQFAELSAPPEARWQPLEPDRAAEILYFLDSLDRDTPPDDLDMSQVLDPAPNYHYEPFVVPTPDDRSYGLHVAQYVIDVSQSDPLRVNDSVEIGSYPSADLAESAQFSLVAVHSGVVDLVGSGDVRADQAMLAAARALAVGNGTLDPEKPLFDDPRFDYRVSAREVVNSIGQELGLLEQSSGITQPQLNL